MFNIVLQVRNRIDCEDFLFRTYDVVLATFRNREISNRIKSNSG